MFLIANGESKRNSLILMGLIELKSSIFGVKGVLMVVRQEFRVNRNERSFTVNILFFMTALSQQLQVYVLII